MRSPKSFVQTRPPLTWSTSARSRYSSDFIIGILSRSRIKSNEVTFYKVIDFLSKLSNSTNLNQKRAFCIISLQFAELFRQIVLIPRAILLVKHFRQDNGKNRVNFFHFAALRRTPRLIRAYRVRNAKEIREQWFHLNFVNCLKKTCYKYRTWKPRVSGSMYEEGKSFQSGMRFTCWSHSYFKSFW